MLHLNLYCPKYLSGVKIGSGQNFLHVMIMMIFFASGSRQNIVSMLVGFPNLHQLFRSCSVDRLLGRVSLNFSSVQVGTAGSLHFLSILCLHFFSQPPLPLDTA